MKKLFKIFLMIFVVMTLLVVTQKKNEKVIAAAPSSYYQDVDTSSGRALQDSLTTIITKGHSAKGYKALWTAYKTTDVKPGTNIIWDMYSNEEFVCGGSKQGASYKKEGDGYNREHSIPQSWFGEKSPMVCDVHHIFPTDGYVNNRRSNFPFGEVSNPTYTSNNGSKLGPSSFSGYNGTVFEPIDMYKGDFARTYFYMATRYSSQVGSWTGNGSAVFSSTYPHLTKYALELFTKWSAEDPVSEKEITRNDAAYSFQGNRNPFIDHPEYIDIVFESKYTTEVTVDQEKVNSVITRINSLPEIITLENEVVVNSVKTAFDALNSKEKELVTNVKVLNDALSTIAELKGQDLPVDDPKPKPDEGAILDGEKVDFRVLDGPTTYTTDVTSQVGDKSFYLSAAGYYGDEFRLGHNKSTSSLSKFGLDIKGQYIEMKYDVEGTTGVTFSHGTSYQLTNWSIYFSSDKGVTYRKVAEGTDTEEDYTASLDQATTGRYALVITNSSTNKNPRVALETMTVYNGEVKPDIFEMEVTYKSSISIDYSTTGVDGGYMRFGVTLASIEEGVEYALFYYDPEGALSLASCYNKEKSFEDFAYSIEEFGDYVNITSLMTQTADGYFYKDILDFTDYYDYPYAIAIVAQKNGKLYFAEDYELDFMAGYKELLNNNALNQASYEVIKSYFEEYLK